MQIRSAVDRKLQEKEMERLVHSKEKPKKLIEVPLRELAVA